jgi:hypothetical protein
MPALPCQLCAPFERFWLHLDRGVSDFILVAEQVPGPVEDQVRVAVRRRHEVNRPMDGRTVIFRLQVRVLVA